MSTITPALWRDLKELAKSLLYEKKGVCLLCDTSIAKNKTFCLECEEAYFHPELHRCFRCGKLIRVEQEVCGDCSEGKGPAELDKVVAWGHYTGAWREFIQAVKFKSQPYLLKKIGSSLADFAIQHLPVPNYLIPVPMHSERLAERGFNQASAIASLLHWQLGIPLWEGLDRVQPTTPQVGLSRQERLHNLERAFQISSELREHKQIHGAKVWLIDDVTTTGATLEHCAKELKKGGVKQVYGLVLAAGLDKR